MGKRTARTSVRKISIVGGWIFGTRLKQWKRLERSLVTNVQWITTVITQWITKRVTRFELIGRFEIVVQAVSRKLLELAFDAFTHKLDVDAWRVFNDVSCTTVEQNNTVYCEHSYAALSSNETFSYQVSRSTFVSNFSIRTKALPNGTKFNRLGLHQSVTSRWKSRLFEHFRLEKDSLVSKASEDYIRIKINEKASTQITG